MNNKPYFLITIDTEGDNLWQKSHEITTQNAQFLPRFQSLCEQYQFKPCYLSNYEMAKDPFFIEFGRDVLKRQTAEIGTHVHAWNTPPEDTIRQEDFGYKSYLIDYPLAVRKQKFDFQHKLLEDTFQTAMRSHRSGRWALDQDYVRLLLEYDYWVDCSVTPCVNWQTTTGHPEGKGGTNYQNFPKSAYFMSADCFEQAGDSSLLQVPMSIRPKYSPLIRQGKRLLNRLSGKHKPDSTLWLRPKQGNVEQMISLAQSLLDEGGDYLEYMLHSSEYMPGGSPTFKDEAAIEGLYRDLNRFFDFLRDKAQGATLQEYYQYKKS